MLLPFVWFASVEVHAALFSVDGSAPGCGGERERSSPASCSEMKSGRFFSLGDDAVATAVVVVGEPALLPATVAAGEGVGGCTGHARPSPDTANFKIRSRRMSLTELYSVRVTSSALGWISSFTNAASNTTGAASSGACADSTSGVEFSLRAPPQQLRECNDGGTAAASDSLQKAAAAIIANGVPRRRRANTVFIIAVYVVVLLDHNGRRRGSATHRLESELP